MPLILPNSIDNDTPADAAELQENYAAIQAYVNTNLLNRDGSVALTSPLLLPGDPTQPNHAANKGYVDGRDALYLPLATGGTVAGATVFSAGGTFDGNVTLGAAADLLLPSATSTIGFGSRHGQHINLYGETYGIGIQSGNMYFRCGPSGNGFRFYHGGVHSDTAGAAGTGGNQSVAIYQSYVELPTTQVGTPRAAVHYDYVHDTFLPKTGGTVTGDVNVTSAGGHLDFGSRLGEHIYMYGSGTYGIGIQSGTQYYRVDDGGVHRFYHGGTHSDSNGVAGSGGVHSMSIAESYVLIGKTASTSATEGVELYGSTGVIYSTNATASSTNLWLRHISSADAVNSYYITFRDNLNNQIGYVQQLPTSVNALRFNAGTGGDFISSSDYRQKNDLGPVDNPLDRLLQLRPRHLEWKPEHGVGEFDGFLAHEVADVTPNAVAGDKDAVNDDGVIIAQGLDQSKLVPLLVAAVQELAARVAELEAA